MVVRVRISASLVISNFLFKGVLDVDFQMSSLKQTQGYVMVLGFFLREKLGGKIKMILTLNPSPQSFSLPSPWCIQRRTWLLINISMVQLHLSQREATLKFPVQGTPLGCLLLTPHQGSVTMLVCCFLNDILCHNPYPLLVMSGGILLLREIGHWVRYFTACSVALFLLEQHKAHKWL